jgi:hypothetical protein
MVIDKNETVTVIGTTILLYQQLSSEPFMILLN